MNTVKSTTLGDRLKNAMYAFRGKPIGSIQYGVSVKKCEDCGFFNNRMRDDLLVTAGARAAYMHHDGFIKLPEGIEGEAALAFLVADIVDAYLSIEDRINFDEYIETILMDKYGRKKGE